MWSPRKHSWVLEKINYYCCHFLHWLPSFVCFELLCSSCKLL
jgi:hypothetical protein